MTVHTDEQGHDLADRLPRSGGAGIPLDSSPAPTSWRVDAARADGRNRRRRGAAVVAVAVASAVAGGLIGTRIQSPADEAAARRPPAASRITAAVEQRVLTSSLVLSGEVRFDEPTAVRLGGPVGADEADIPIVTRVPAVDQVTQEGDVVFEVTGRPVFFLQGDLPMYRRLAVGSVGADVAQLEVALDRLGYSPGTVDDVFDEGTANALASMYAAAGYVAEGPDAAERDSLAAARQAVVAAEASATAAKRELADLSAGVPGSQLLQARQAVAAAEGAVPTSQASATRADELAAEQVRAATATRDTAIAARSAAFAARDAAIAPGAIDPDTGSAPTETRIADLQVAAARASEDAQLAETALVGALNDQQTVAAAGRDGVIAAVAQLDLARMQLAELSAPVVLTDAQLAVEQAQAALELATADEAEMTAAAGIRVSAGELVFLPTMPSTVTELFVGPGSSAVDQLATMSAAETLVSAHVAPVDAPLVTVGGQVTLSIRDTPVETTGTVVSVGQPEQAGDGGGRLEVLIAPDDEPRLRDYVSYGVRVTVDVASTDGDAMVVPVSALSVGADGATRVEVETEPVADDDQGSTVLVEVEVGLAAEGLVEVTSAELAPGDRVVLGTGSINPETEGGNG